MRQKFKEFIKKLVGEILSELDEASVSGNAGPYSTPHAFGKKSKKKKHTNSTNFKLTR
jgi:hypothetical protein